MLSNNSEINNILNNINMLHTENYNDNQNNSVKKGRGRPRKETNEDQQQISEPKKRGRKPKENKPTLNKSITKNEEIVLHLPNINALDLAKHNIFIQSTKTDTSENNNIFTICDSDDDSSSFNSEKNELLLKIKNMGEQISHLENKLNECTTNSSNSKFSIDRHNVTKMDINLIDYTNGNTIVLEQTDIACWWCTESFTTLPCFIVRDKKHKAYVVFGCFCSYNCAITFNLQMDDFKMWDRYSLTKQLYNEITSTTDNIHPAGPREVLKKFGGPCSIEKFRENSNIVTKEYRCVIPPMMTIVPFIEEHNKTVKKNINNDVYTNKNNDLVLKREKPLPTSKNNLMNAFNFNKKH